MSRRGWLVNSLVPRRVSAKVAAEGFELRERRASS